jgi:hypothetical protein
VLFCLASVTSLAPVPSSSSGPSTNPPSGHGVHNMSQYFRNFSAAIPPFVDRPESLLNMASCKSASRRANRRDRWRDSARRVVWHTSLPCRIRTAETTPDVVHYRRSSATADPRLGRYTTGWARKRGLIKGRFRDSPYRRYGCDWFGFRGPSRKPSSSQEIMRKLIAGTRGRKTKPISSPIPHLPTVRNTTIQRSNPATLQMAK